MSESKKDSLVPTLPNLNDVVISQTPEWEEDIMARSIVHDIVEKYAKGGPEPELATGKVNGEKLQESKDGGVREQVAVASDSQNTSPSIPSPLLSKQDDIPSSAKETGQGTQASTSQSPAQKDTMADRARSASHRFSQASVNSRNQPKSSKTVLKLPIPQVTPNTDCPDQIVVELFDPLPETISAADTKVPARTVFQHGPLINMSQGDWDKANDYIAAGMDFHERGNMTASASAFEQAAQLGAPLGLYFYGLCLRHGWGTEMDEVKGFSSLYQAATNGIKLAELEIERVRQYERKQSKESNGTNVPDTFKSSMADSKGTSSISFLVVSKALEESSDLLGTTQLIYKSELALILMELAVCYQRGWGVPVIPVYASHYFRLASWLGDPDAQNEMGFCCRKGFGVHRDKKRSALYYRMAADRGNGLVSNSWIYKDKYL